jgi:hypothetical protein
MRMPPSKKVQRMAMIRDIQLHMMEALFDDRLVRSKIHQEIQQIANANMVLIKANTCTFMFGSKWYPEISDTYAPECNRTLHESFRVRVNELVNGVDSKARMFKAAVSTLISNVLSVIRHTDDLYSIFPRELQAVIPVVDTTLFNIGSPLSKEEIAEINLINIPNLAVFHKLLMNRLLCAQVVP